MSTPGATPRPGPAGQDTDELRSAFDDLMADSVGAAASTDLVPGEDSGVRDDQVRALDAAHELLARALSALDTAR